MNQRIHLCWNCDFCGKPMITISEAGILYCENCRMSYGEITDVVKCGPQALQATCYGNATVSQNFYDADNKVFLTEGTTSTTNLSLAANGVANIEVTYKGTAKKSSMPFGGCMVIEYPTTVSAVTGSGAGISLSTPCRYPVTYTVSSTSNTYKSVDVPAGFDINGAGDIKTIPMQIKATGFMIPCSYRYIDLSHALGLHSLTAWVHNQ